MFFFLLSQLLQSSANHPFIINICFLPRERGIYLVIPSTPTKLNTTFAPLVVSTHSTNLAQILRDVAFHCSVWMKKKLERMQRLFHVML